MPEEDFWAAHALLVKNLIATICVIVIMTCALLFFLLPSDVKAVAAILLSVIVAGCLSYILYVVIPQLIRRCRRNRPDPDVELGPVNQIMDRASYLHPVTIRRPMRMPWRRSTGPRNANASEPEIPPEIFSSVRSESGSANGKETRPSEPVASTSGIKLGLDGQSTSAEFPENDKILPSGVTPCSDKSESEGSGAESRSPNPPEILERVELPSNALNRQTGDSLKSAHGESIRCSRCSSATEPPSVQESSKRRSVSSSCSIPSSRKSTASDSSLHSRPVMPAELLKELRSSLISLNKRKENLPTSENGELDKTDKSSSYAESRSITEKTRRESSSSVSSIQSSRSAGPSSSLGEKLVMPSGLLEQIRTAAHSAGDLKSD